MLPIPLVELDPLLELCDDEPEPIEVDESSEVDEVDESSEVDEVEELLLLD